MFAFLLLCSLFASMSFAATTELLTITASPEAIRNGIQAVVQQSILINSSPVETVSTIVSLLKGELGGHENDVMYQTWSSTGIVVLFGIIEYELHTGINLPWPGKTANVAIQAISDVKVCQAVRLGVSSFVRGIFDADGDIPNAQAFMTEIQTELSRIKNT